MSGFKHNANGSKVKTGAHTGRKIGAQKLSANAANRGRR